MAVLAAAEVMLVALELGAPEFWVRATVVEMVILRHRVEAVVALVLLVGYQQQALVETVVQERQLQLQVPKRTLLAAAAGVLLLVVQRLSVELGVAAMAVQDRLMRQLLGKLTKALVVVELVNLMIRLAVQAVQA